MPMVAMIQRPGGIKNATRDIWPRPSRSSWAVSCPGDPSPLRSMGRGGNGNRSEEDEELANDNNLDFSDWPTVFSNAACVTALIDRVVHHAEIIATEAESYHRCEAQQGRAAQPSRRPRPKDRPGRFRLSAVRRDRQHVRGRRRHRSPRNVAAPARSRCARAARNRSTRCRRPRSRGYVVAPVRAHRWRS